MDERLATVDEAASFLRVSRETVLRHLRTGKLRGVKVGQLWRIPRAELEKLAQPEGD